MEGDLNTLHYSQEEGHHQNNEYQNHYQQKDYHQTNPHDYDDYNKNDPNHLERQNDEQISEMNTITTMAIMISNKGTNQTPITTMNPISLNTKIMKQITMSHNISNQIPMTMNRTNMTLINFNTKILIKLYK